MSDRGEEIEDLGAWSELPPGDPRLLALSSRPGVRARLRAYQEFMAPGDAPLAQRQLEAEKSLAEMLAREIGIPITSPAGPGAGTPAAREASASPRAGRTLPEWFARRGSRPIFAAAAVLIVTAGAVMFLGRHSDRDGSLLRGSAAPMSGHAWQPNAGTRITPNGGVVLHWNAEPRATRYGVVFLSGDLGEADRIDGVTTTELVLTRDALPRGLTPGAQVLWRVTAYQGADELGHSPAAPLQLP